MQWDIQSLRNLDKLREHYFRIIQKPFGTQLNHVCTIIIALFNN